MNYSRFILSAICLMMVSVSTAQKVGLLLDSYVTDRWYLDQKFFSEKVKELGGECFVEVPHGDADEQIRLGKKLIADRMDVLVLVAVDARKALSIIEAAKAANIPVVAYDRLIHSSDLAFYISYNNVKVGRLQAQYALSKVPSGNYLLINGPRKDNNSSLFKNGQMTVLQAGVNKGKVKIIGDITLEAWSGLEALLKTDEFLSGTDEKPDVIIAANDGIAFGVIQALPAELRGKIIITGQDADLTAIKNIIDGTQSMTIYKPIKPLAYQGAEIAMKLAKQEKIKNVIKLKNGDFDVDAILLDPLVVDKSNYMNTVVKDGHINAADLDR